MTQVEHHYKSIVSSIPSSVQLVAVSKTKPASQILELYNCGHRKFGESKAQEMVSKYEQLPKDIQWHMIGHLQTNKVKYIAPFVSLIHSVDSLKLLMAINKEGFKNNRVIDCLLQMYIAKEETKFGLDPEEIDQILQSAEYKSMKNIRITGLMGMATLTDDTNLIGSEFETLAGYFDSIKSKYFHDEDSFCEISMGMSDDYQIAIEKGSTIVRIGSLIFGNRYYGA